MEDLIAKTKKKKKEFEGPITRSVLNPISNTLSGQMIFLLSIFTIQNFAASSFGSRYSLRKESLRLDTSEPYSQGLLSWNQKSIRSVASFFSPNYAGQESRLAVITLPYYGLGSRAVKKGERS